MIKTIISIVCSLVLSLLIVSYGYCGWPISHTPAIEGIVIDATSGKPIENVMINCVWMKSIWALVDKIDTSYGQTIVLTDKNGRYSIKPKTTLHMLSVFDSIMFQANHPLYESKMTGWSMGILEHMKMGDVQYNDGGVKINIQGKYENGKIKYNVLLLSLEEKYINNFKRTGKYQGSFTSFLESMTGNSFVIIKKKYGLRLDIDYFLEKWINIASELSPLGSNQEPYIWKQIDRLKKEFKEIKQEGY